MFAGKKIAVTLPAYNESKLIGAAISGIPEYVDHIIVVDDASTDNTVDAVPHSHYGRTVTIVRHEVNQGVGAAIATGYRTALETSADVVVVMAGDAQMDPDDLAFLLNPVIRGEADYAKGDRLSWPGVTKAMPFSRFCGNHILSKLTRFSSGYGDIRDSQCGYTAVSAEVLRRVNLDALYPRYGFPNDMLAKLHAVAARVVNVPVRPIYGEEVSGISLYTAVVRVPLVLIRSMMWRLKTERRAARLTAGDISNPSLEPIDG